MAEVHELVWSPDDSSEPNCSLAPFVAHVFLLTCDAPAFETDVLKGSTNASNAVP
jgi:hypothetical protein